MVVIFDLFASESDEDDALLVKPEVKLDSNLSDPNDFGIVGIPPLLDPSDLGLVFPPNPPNDAEGEAPNADFCSPFIVPNDPDDGIPKPGTPLLTPPKLGDAFDSKVVTLDLTPPPNPGTPLLTPPKPGGFGEDDLICANVELDFTLPPKEDPTNADFCSPFIAPNDPDEDLPKPGTPLLTPPKPGGVGEDDLICADVELDLSLPNGDPPNADFCSPFIALNDPGEDAPKPGTPLLTPPKPGEDVIFESKAVTLDLTPPPKAGAPLFKPVGEDDLVSASVELVLMFPLKGDPPIADVCSPFIVTSDPDDDIPKPGTPLLTPPKLGDTFDSKDVVLDLTPSIGNFDEELKAGVPLLTPLKPVAENDLFSRDMELDLSPPKGDTPNTDFCSPFIAFNDPDDDAPKPGTPLLTPPKPGGEFTFEAATLDLAPLPKDGTLLLTPPKPGGAREDDLICADVELDLSPPKGDPPNADFCSPFIFPRDPDEDVPKPGTPLLTPPKLGDTFESKVVVLDLTPPVEKFDEEPKPGTLLVMPLKLGGPPLIGDCGEEPKPVDPLSIPSNEFTLSFAVVPLFSGDVLLCFTKPDPVAPAPKLPDLLIMFEVLNPDPTLLFIGDPVPNNEDGLDADIPLTGIPKEPAAVKPDD
jgi:hypothetical protein